MNDKIFAGTGPKAVYNDYNDIIDSGWQTNYVDRAPAEQFADLSSIMFYFNLKTTDFGRYIYEVSWAL